MTEPVRRRLAGRHLRTDAQAEANSEAPAEPQRDAAARAGKAAADPAHIAAPPTAEFLLGVLVAVVVGAGLSVAAWRSAVGLLAAVAVVQFLLTVAFAAVTGVPGRTGALIIAGAAAIGSDVVVSVWPHGRLGVLLPVYGLAVPALFVHQLARGAARVRIVASLAGAGMLVVLVTALPALIQLRHEFVPSNSGGRLVAGIAIAAAGALVVGYFVDLVMPAPRFDVAIPRGLLALIAAGGIGGSVGHLVMAEGTQFDSARAIFAGAAVGALAGFFAIAAAFIAHSSVAAGSFGYRVRPLYSVLLPIALVSPVAFLLCLAIRT